MFSSRSVYFVIRFEVASEISSSSALTSSGEGHGRLSSARSSFGVICDVFSSRSVYFVIFGKSGSDRFCLHCESQLSKARRNVLIYLIVESKQITKVYTSDCGDIGHTFLFYSELIC